MKKLLLILIVLFSLAFAAEKTFTLKMSEAQLNKHWQKLIIIKNIVDQSNLPHDQVKFIILSIDSLQMDIQKQVSDTLLNPKQ